MDRKFRDMPYRSVSVLAGCLATLFLSACDRPRGKVEGDVLQSLASSDSALKATVAKAGHGATVAFVYRVYLGAAGGDVSEILRADHVDSIRIEWTGPDALIIHMPCGRIFAFTNFFPLINSEGKLEREVQVTLENSGLCKDK